MGPGPVEEVGKVAGGFLDIFKSQPLSLALIVMNIALLMFVFYSENRAAEGRRIAFNSFMQVSQLLAHCVVPQSEFDKLKPPPHPPDPSVFQQ
jgi:hypothetical protein